MSGIVSLLNLDGEPIAVSQLRQMTDFMAFRGPDAQENWSNGLIGLGHTLLRTTFESEQEHQPFTLDGQVWIVADARIDDRANLLHTLRAKERIIADDVPDVELILHAYQVWDTACVDHLMGDFVFIIWDDRQQRLFCTRDQFGVLPLYYAQVNNTLICSNTLKCIQLHPQISAALNEQAVGDFLLFGMNMDAATTTFADIQRLPPAHSLIWSDGKLRIDRYWSLPQNISLLRYKRSEEYVEHFYEIFQQAVGDRLRTNRLATHLSGGLDSTSIAAIAHKLLSAKGKPFELQAFTIGYTELMPDEDYYGGMVADSIGLPIKYIDGDSYLQAIPTEQPEISLPEPTFIPVRAAESGLLQQCAAYGRVALTGFGGDPALKFGEVSWLEWFKQGQFGHWLAVQTHYLRLYRRRPPFYFRTGLGYQRRLLDSYPPLPNWLNSTFVNKLDLPTRQQKVAADPVEQIGRRGMATSPYWSNLFAWGDPGFTSFPLKYYYPFFDIRLVNYLLAILPVPWLIDKRLLREAMRGLLPEPVRSRRKALNTKSPFSVDLEQRGQEWTIKFLTTTPSLTNYVNCSELSALIQSSENKLIGENRLVENALAFAYWLRTQQRV